MPKQKVGHKELATYRTRLALKTKLIYFSPPTEVYLKCLKKQKLR